MSLICPFFKLIVNAY